MWYNSIYSRFCIQNNTPASRTGSETNISASCKQLYGSGVRFAYFPNLDCGIAPAIKTITTAAIAINARTATVTVTLPLLTPGVLTEGTILYFVDGATTYPVIVDAPTTVPYNYVPGTALTINIKRQAIAVPVTAVAQSYLGRQICVKKAELVPSPTTLDNSTTCTGKVSTSVTVATEYKLDVSMLATNDAAYWELRKLSYDLSSIYFALSYDGQSFDIGGAQLVALTSTGAEAKNQIMSNGSFNVQNFDVRYAGVKGSTSAEVALQDVDRKLWGLELTGVTPVAS